MIVIILVMILLLFLDVMPSAIDSLSISVIILLTLYKFEKYIKDWVVIVLSMIFIILSFVLKDDLFPLFKGGIIGFGFLNLVLFTGVLPNKYSITKLLLRHRALLSIAGVIMILPHVYFQLFDEKVIDVLGLSAFIVMIPLFITSFVTVRKELSHKEWHKLHKLSYIVYILIFLHLIVVAAVLSKLVYIVLLTLYVNNKILKEIKHENI